MLPLPLEEVLREVVVLRGIRAAEMKCKIKKEMM